MKRCLLMTTLAVFGLLSGIASAALLLGRGLLGLLAAVARVGTRSRTGA